jgi:integrase
MSKSRKVGPFRVRPEPYLYKGIEATKWRLEIPASLTGNGKRKRKLFDTCKEALTVARELRKRIDPVTGQLVVQRNAKGLRLNDVVHDWKADEALRVETLKKRSTTLEVDEYRLKALKAYFGDYALEGITERQILSYQSWRLKAGRKPITINSEVALLTRILRWGKKQGYVSAIPEIEQIPVVPVKVDIPTPEEVVRIIQALPERLQPVVRFLAETGCRVGEALNLSWDCVDEISGAVEIKSREGWTPKTRQSERRIPLNRGLLECMRELPKEGPLVFPGPDPDNSMGNFRKAFNAAVDEANIRRKGKRVHLTPKVLRKAYASWQAERGVDESVLQDYLGHARGSRITRQHYVHASEEAKVAAVIELPIGKRKAD